MTGVFEAFTADREVAKIVKPSQPSPQQSPKAEVEYFSLSIEPAWTVRAVF